jgi:hypothetical protein
MLPRWQAWKRDMSPDPRSHADTLLYVEQEDSKKFRIKSDQLEQIGARLRGRPRFSVFNSIILPLFVSVVTIVCSSLFQYVSWINSVRLQNANEIAAKAAEKYSRVDAVMGQRRYASFLFISSMQNGEKKWSDENSIMKFDSELKKRRFDSYYERLREWNEGYDRLLTDIDYDLDRPLFLQAKLESEGVHVFNAKISKINCALSLSEQLENQELNKDSLKLQFAGINFCFSQIHGTLNAQRILRVRTRRRSFKISILEPFTRWETSSGVMLCTASTISTKRRKAPS